MQLDQKVPVDSRSGSSISWYEDLKCSLIRRCVVGSRSGSSISWSRARVTIPHSS